MNIVERKTYGIIANNFFQSFNVDEFAVGVALDKRQEKKLNESYQIYKMINPENLSTEGYKKFGSLKNQLLVFGFESIRKIK